MSFLNLRFCRLSTRQWSFPIIFSSAKSVKSHHRFQPLTLINASKHVHTKPVAVPSQGSPLKDIIIFRYENPKQFKLLNFFAITQFGFWMFLSISSFSLIDVPVGAPNKVEDASQVDTKASDDLPFYRKINLGEKKYKYGLCIATFLMGYGILFGSWLYIVRSVRYLILRKDRKTVSFVTYGPLGTNRIMDVPLNCISAAGSRNSGGSQMPVKVKNKFMFYMLELKGDFPNPKLFDQTVGIERNLKF